MPETRIPTQKNPKSVDHALSDSNSFSLAKRMKWDKDFQKYLKELDKKKPVVWCGDLNVLLFTDSLFNELRWPTKK
jgi:exonuclease III